MGRPLRAFYPDAARDIVHQELHPADQEVKPLGTKFPQENVERTVTKAVLRRPRRVCATQTPSVSTEDKSTQTEGPTLSQQLQTLRLATGYPRPGMGRGRGFLQ